MFERRSMESLNVESARKSPKPSDQKSAKRETAEKSSMEKLKDILTEEKLATNSIVR